MTRLRTPSALAGLPVAACLLAGGCGATERAEPGGPRPGGSGTAAPQVLMQDIRFLPARVVVKRGGTVTWRNRDALSHTVTKQSGPGPRFHSGTVAGGGTYRRRFTAAGVIEYACTIHPNHTGTVVVR